LVVDYRTVEFHQFNRLGKRILFNVETLQAYEVSSAVFDAVSLLDNPGQTDPISELTGRHPMEQIQKAVAYLIKEGFLFQRSPDSDSPVPILKKRHGIRHLELMVTHDCPMRCRYCYGASGPGGWEGAPYLYGATDRGMSIETAQSGVDFLFASSGPRKDLSIIFFGGEPLLAVDLIEELIPHIRHKEKVTGKTAGLSLSTNGLLLTPKVVEFLTRHRIGCQVSIDGPPEIHDRNRVMADGAGSYANIIKGVKRLLLARPRRTSARATIARGAVDLPAIAEHLLNLGFGSVHLEPAIGGASGLRITPEDTALIKEQNEELAHFLVKSVRNNRFFNYANLVRYIRQTRVVRDRQAHYCGAGRTYFALSQEGDFYPCHRFVGMDAYRMGSLAEGMDLSLQRRILDLTVDNRPVCRECWARYLCGGGCWKHAVDAHEDLATPDETVSCELIRHIIECALAVNSELSVSDKDILSQLYEENTEPYLVTENEEGENDQSADRQANDPAGISRVAV
jgi:uncharacterized protein